MNKGSKSASKCKSKSRASRILLCLWERSMCATEAKNLVLLEVKGKKILFEVHEVKFYSWT